MSGTVGPDIPRLVALSLAGSILPEACRLGLPPSGRVPQCGVLTTLAIGRLRALDEQLLL